MATGRMSWTPRRSTKASSSIGGSARRRQAVGLSVQIWSASAPISWARSTARTMPVASGRWAPMRRWSGGIRGIVRCRPWMTRSRPTRRFTARTIRSFIRDGRLTTIPAREKRRQVIYRYLRDQVFTEDRAYPEAEVNLRLALFHPRRRDDPARDGRCRAWSPARPASTGGGATDRRGVRAVRRR